MGMSQQIAVKFPKTAIKVCLANSKSYDYTKENLKVENAFSCFFRCFKLKKTVILIGA
jgi:hypothetical protein